MIHVEQGQCVKPSTNVNKSKLEDVCLLKHPTTRRQEKETEATEQRRTQIVCLTTNTIIQSDNLLHLSKGLSDREGNCEED